jgi:hypothetical protein
MYTYDPELVGYFLRRVVPDAPTGDFQDLPIWRTLVASVALALDEHYAVPLIVPMTIVNPDYFTQILDQLRARELEVHTFALMVSAGELRQRITNQIMNPDDAVDDQRIRQWRLDEVVRCVVGFTGDCLGTPIANQGRTVYEVVSDILGRLPPELVGSDRG